jgi:hypothetical protein
MLTPYADNNLIKLYIKNVSQGCREERVDHLWSQILSFYWPISANYGVEREPYASETSRTRANLVLTNNQMGKIYKCLFIECKRPHESVNEDLWETPEAETQLLRHIRNWTDRDPSRPLYGIISIGLEVKFFFMPAWSDKFETFSENTPVLSLKTDSARIHQILVDIRAILSATQSIEYVYGEVHHRMDVQGAIESSSGNV